MNKNNFGFRKALHSNSYKIKCVKDFFYWLKKTHNLSKMSHKFKNMLNMKNKYASEYIANDLNLLKVADSEGHKNIVLLNFFERNYLFLKNKIYNFLIFIKLKKERNLFALGITNKINRNFNRLYLQNRINLINKLLIKSYSFNKITEYRVRKISNHLFELDC